MTLCVQADVERFLQINVTAEPSPVVDMLIENAEATIKTYCGRSVLEETASITETHDPPGWSNPHLFLFEYPIVSVQSVTEDGTVLTLDEDYQVRRMSLTRISGSGWVTKGWRAPLRGIVVEYTAGYTADGVELRALRDVCTRMVARAWQPSSALANTPAGSEGIQSVTLAGSDSVTYRDNLSDVATAAVQLTDLDKMALHPYRKRVLI